MQKKAGEKITEKNDNVKEKNVNQFFQSYFLAFSMREIK